MRLKRIVKDFEFVEENRTRIALGTGTRLVPDRNVLTLAPDEATRKYNTSSAGFTARTWVTNPASMRQWLFFQVEDRQSKNPVTGAVVTSQRFRITDGTSEFWWSGSAWVVDTVNWNTEAEVSAHLPVFQSKKLGFVINMVTTDARFTPQVFGLRVAFSSDVSEQEDIIFRSLVPSLESGLRPITDYLVKLQFASNAVSLVGENKLETPYRIVDCDSVFVETDDPDHFVDVLVSFDPTQLRATLSGVVAAGKTVRLRLVYSPPVHINTSQDFSQIASVPALVIDSITFAGNEIGARDGVGDRSTYAAVKTERPWMGDLDFTIEAITEKQVDHQRLIDELKRYFSNNPLITSKGLDETYRLWMVPPQYSSSEHPNKSDLHTSTFKVRIPDVLVFGRDMDTTLVKDLALTLKPLPVTD